MRWVLVDGLLVASYPILYETLSRNMSSLFCATGSFSLAARNNLPVAVRGRGALTDPT